MATQGDVTNIPHYLEAPSLGELQRRMLQNNVKNGFEYRYFDIQKDGNNWICFYYKKMNTQFNRTESSNGIK